MRGAMVVASALGSALLYALAAVAQQRAARDEPMEHSLRLRLLFNLLHRPLWLAGLVCDVGAFLLQFYALDHGGLVLVQPLLVSGLLFALPLGALVSHERMRRADWVGAGLVVIGLSVFLIVAQPDRGSADASPKVWLMLVVSILAMVSLLIFLAQHTSGSRRAGFLAASAGTLYGLTAALTKACGNLFDQGLKHLFTSWKPYALAAGGVSGTVIDQSAYQAGPLNWSLPILTVTDPVVSIAIGAFVFGEGINIAGIAPIIEAAALIVMTIGVFQLSTSPLVARVKDEGPAEERK
ncbi:MAG: DMT family transporter [Acidimicrobiia bacterium]|nr:DMT family transporter [Acidimicrobiia bacterium]